MWTLSDSDAAELLNPFGGVRKVLRGSFSIQTWNRETSRDAGRVPADDHTLHDPVWSDVKLNTHIFLKKGKEIK